MTEEVEKRVAARLERQALLERDGPPLLWFAIDEGVLHLPIGDPEIMREQLRALLSTSEHSCVTIQVVPMSAGAHPGLGGAFVVGSFDGAPDVVYLESTGEGHVVDRADEVRTITAAYDAIRAEALPAPASIKLIAKVMEQWS